MIAKEQQGKAVEVKELADNMHTAVSEVVKRQVDVGIDIISEEELW